MSDRIRLLIEGTVSTDGGYVYVGGMDLSEILRASTPGYEKPKYPGSYVFPDAVVRIEIRPAESTDESKGKKGTI